MDGFKVQVPEFTSVVERTKRLVSASDPYQPVQVHGVKHGRLSSAIGDFNSAWDYGIDVSVKDLSEYALRLSNTLQAYTQNDQFLAEDIEAAWEGRY